MYQNQGNISMLFIDNIITFFFSEVNIIEIEMVKLNKR